jgi:hypothetical protein
MREQNQLAHRLRSKQEDADDKHWVDVEMFYFIFHFFSLPASGSVHSDGCTNIFTEIFFLVCRFFSFSFLPSFFHHQPHHCPIRNTLVVIKV